MFRNSIHLDPVCALLVASLCGCTQQAPVDLVASLKGIEQSKFLSCSGPPILALSGAGQDRMSFVTNLVAAMPLVSRVPGRAGGFLLGGRSVSG